MTREHLSRPLLLLLSTLALGCPGEPPAPLEQQPGVQSDGGSGPDAGCADPCAGTCCGAEQVCRDGACTDVCVPACGGRQCGDDGCGGSCGACAQGTTCSAGQCVASCVPDCDGKQCGDDGCGGSCGECGGLLVCGGAGVEFQCGRPPQPCSADDWCGVPSGTNGILMAVWGASTDDVYAASMKTTSLETQLLTWRGAKWEPAPHGELDAIVVGMRGSGAADLWIAGASTLGDNDGLLARYDGTKVVSTHSVVDGYAAGVHALSETAAIAVGAHFGEAAMSGFVSRWDGETWTELTLPDSYGPLFAVWANSVDDFWVAGVDGVVLHHAAGTWSEHPTGRGLQLSRAWGSGPDDVWFVGDAGVIARWNGTALELLETSVDFELYGISGTSPDDVWIVGDFGTVLHWDGTRLARKESGTTVMLTDVWAASPADVWAVGEVGTILRYRP